MPCNGPRPAAVPRGPPASGLHAGTWSNHHKVPCPGNTSRSFARLCSMCPGWDRGSPETREEEVTAEYEPTFYRRGLTVSFCQPGLGSLHVDSLLRTVWEQVLASAQEMGLAERFLCTRGEVTQCLQSPRDQEIAER